MLLAPMLSFTRLVNENISLDFSLEYLGDGETNRPDDFVDNIDEVFVGGETATVVASEWYTINGVRVAEPKQRGIYIRRDKMSDGTVKAEKVMVR